MYCTTALFCAGITFMNKQTNQLTKRKDKREKITFYPKKRRKKMVEMLNQRFLSMSERKKNYKLKMKPEMVRQK